jgi:hypothetical protein
MPPCERMKALPDANQQSWPANCLLDRTGIGSIFELSDRVEAENEDKGAWA